MPGPDPIDVAFSFDTTGSMRSAIGEVRRQITQVGTKLYTDIPGLHLGGIAHGDYCDGDKVMTTQDLTDDMAMFSDFIRTAPDTYGGDAPECYELVLHKARSLNWRAGKQKVLVLIGDDEPHGPRYRENTLNLDWRNELKLLVELGVHVYSVQCLARRHATYFYKEMADVTGGLHLQLHQFNAIVDLVMAICYKQKGNDALLNFEKKVEEAGRMTDVTGSCFDMMAGREPRKVRSSGSAWKSSGTAKRLSHTILVGGGTIDVGKLEPVHPSRFQIIGIEGDCPIKQVVTDNKLAFKTGRGFYEFTKTVTVQPKKEVVLIDDDTGAMFSGDDARLMIGLPEMGEGGNVRLKPGPLVGFTAFIQSTSHNRKLLGGTKFLYEMEDYDVSAEAA